MLRYGKRSHSGDGYSYSLDSRGRSKAGQELAKSGLRQFRDRLNFYVVVSSDDDTVVTVAHRYKRRHAN